MNRRWWGILALAWLTIILALGCYSVRSLNQEGKIQFDLLALLPQGKSENLRLSNELMEDANLAGRIVIAFGHEDEGQSKEAIKQFRKWLQANDLPIEEYQAKEIEKNYRRIFTDLYPYRACLLSKSDRQILLQGKSELLANRAISNILSPFGTFTANQIKSDPFGFYPQYVTSFHFNDALSRDTEENICLKSEGKVWFIFQGAVVEKIFSLRFQEKIAQSLLPILSKIEKDTHTEVLKIGAIFYASAGAQLAQNEISQIGLVSTIGIILILLLIFRLPHPILLAIIVVSSGLLCGLAACLFLFGSIHILALVFGCSLVGVAVDYALHYYCASFKTIDRFNILKSLLPAMPLGVLTSAIGYGALIIAPFPGIQQMALLACVGLLCTFISVSFWGPYFIRKGERKVPPLAERFQNILEKFACVGSIRYLKPVLFLILFSIFCGGASLIKFDDNVKNFQALDPQLKSQEERLKKMMSFDHATQFLTIKAESLESLLQKEEAITDILNKAGVNYRALSDLLPSLKRQNENKDLKLTFSKKHFLEVSNTLGLAESLNLKEAGFDEVKLVPTDEFLTNLPMGWKELIRVSEQGHKTSRIMLTSKVDPSLIAGLKDVTYVNPIHEYSSLFASYREVMIILVGGLFLGFLILITLRQGYKAAITITSPVLLSILTTVGILGILNIGFSMFHAMGLILVLCIGIDYGLFLFWRNPNEKELLLLGNGLAAITTILSFGFLSLSTTEAVHSFGLSVFIGIVLNFFITTLFLGNKRCIN